MNILEFLLSKKILIVLSGLLFTGAALASSGAESLFQENSLVSPETKIPEVQNIIDNQQTPQQKSPAAPPAPTTKPIPSSTPIVSATPKPTTKPKISASPSSNPTTITGLRQSGSEEDKEDTESEKADGSDSEISNAFQKAREETKEED